MAQQASVAARSGRTAAEPRFERVYVWQRPIRLFHWTAVASVTTLFVTGLLISTPIFSGQGEAWEVFVMGRVRQVHFAAAYVFVVAYVWRSLWFFLGNRYARSGFPAVWKARWWHDLARQINDYLRFDFGTPHAGHNALGGLSYTIFVIGLGMAQILTGFALYGESNPGGFWDSLVGWVIPLLGGSARTHVWHHLFAWGFAVFAILHVYIVFYDGQQYKNGLVTSMVSGVKFYQEGDLDHDTWLS